MVTDIENTGAEKPAKMRIGIFGAGPGCGVSFIAGSLAYMAASGEKGQGAREKPRTKGGAQNYMPKKRTAKVTLAELGTPYFYSALSFEKREALYPFCSVARLLEERKSLRSAENLHQGINWLIREPKAPETAFDGGRLFRLIASAPGDMLFFDCSGGLPADPFDIAAEMDRIFFVIDPLPTKLIKQGPWISRFLLEFPEATVIVNKNNSGVHAGELRRFLGRRDYISVPFVSPEIIYKAEFNSLLPAQLLRPEELFAAAYNDMNIL